jgi:hypothetical protein
MAHEGDTPRGGKTRRNVLRGITAGAAGMALPSLSSRAASAQSEPMPDISQYSNRVVQFTDKKTLDEKYPTELESEPGAYSRRQAQSLVTHTGPVEVDNVDNQVQYTFTVHTVVSNNYVDANSDHVQVHRNVDSIENIIEWDKDTVDIAFNSGSSWVGNGIITKTAAQKTLDDLRDGDTLLGVTTDYAISQLIGLVPYLGTVWDGVQLLDGAYNAVDETEKHTVSFTYGDPAPHSIRTFRKFVVFVPADAKTELSIKTDLWHDKYGNSYGAPDLEHTITLEPQKFVHDIGTHPFEDAIRSLIEETPISGYPPSSSPELVGGRFRPERRVKRAEFASMIHDALTPYSTERETFSDIDGHWAEDKIELAAGAGYISGYPDGTFRPEQYVTRLEVLLALNAGEGYPDYETTTYYDSYDDAFDVPDWARQAAVNVHSEWLPYGGIQNYPESNQGLVQPDQDATRADVARYIRNALLARQS